MTIHAIEALVKRIEMLERKLNHQDRLINNLFREGKVSDVDYGKGLARVVAQDLESKWVPWIQRAGDFRDWEPVTVDERVILINPSGEPGRGLILPGGYSDQFAQNHNVGGEAARDRGDTRIFQNDKEVWQRSGDRKVGADDQEAFARAGNKHVRVTSEGVFINC